MVCKEVQRIPDILLTRGLNFLTNQIMTGLLGDVIVAAFNTANSRHYNNPQEQDLASSIMNALDAAVHQTRDTNEFKNLAGDPINLFNIDQRLLAEFMKENQKEYAKFTARQEEKYAEGAGVLSEVADYKERLAETSNTASTFKYRVSNLQSELDKEKRQNEILEERIAKLEELLSPQETTIANEESTDSD